MSILVVFVDEEVADSKIIKKERAMPSESFWLPFLPAFIITTRLAKYTAFVHAKGT